MLQFKICTFMIFFLLKEYLILHNMPLQTLYDQLLSPVLNSLMQITTKKHTLYMCIINMKKTMPFNRHTARVAALRRDQCMQKIPSTDMVYIVHVYVWYNNLQITKHAHNQPVQIVSEYITSTQVYSGEVWIVLALRDILVVYSLVFKNDTLWFKRYMDIW